MRTKQQIINEYGQHLGERIIKELQGVGIKRDNEGNSLFNYEDIKKAERRATKDTIY